MVSRVCMHRIFKAGEPAKKDEKSRKHQVYWEKALKADTPEQRFIKCSPSLKEYAFWDRPSSTYKCCNKFPTGWDACARYYAKCEGSVVAAPKKSKVAADQPKETVWVMIDSAAPVEDSASSSLSLSLSLCVCLSL